MSNFKSYTKDWDTKTLDIPIDEIVAEYRAAKYPTSQIDIMADLCGTKPCRIAWILKQCGLLVDPKKLPRERRNPETRDYVKFWEEGPDAVECDRIRKMLEEQKAERCESLAERLAGEPILPTEKKETEKEEGVGMDENKRKMFESENAIIKRLEENEEVCRCTEEKPGCEKYRNYCECCARNKSGACNVCESGYDGVPSEYLYELARKSQEDIRGDILEQAKICVCTDRKEQYGEAEQSFRCIADMWNAYLRPVYPDICITPVQASMMMVLFKAARDAVAKVHKVDTYVDMCGYAACAGGMLE